MTSLVCLSTFGDPPIPNPIHGESRFWNHKDEIGDFFS